MLDTAIVITQIMNRKKMNTSINVLIFARYIDTRYVWRSKMTTTKKTLKSLNEQVFY